MILNLFGTSWRQWAVDWITYLSQEDITLRARVFALETKVNSMSQEFDTLKADVVKLQGVAQSTADSLVSAQKDIADLKTQIANGNIDPAQLTALASSVEATLNSIASELPAPTPPVVTDPPATT